jgi:hypothetical protein
MIRRIKEDIRTLDISDLLSALSLAGFLCSMALWLLILSEKLPVDLQ